MTWGFRCRSRRYCYFIDKRLIHGARSKEEKEKKGKVLVLRCASWLASQGQPALEDFGEAVIEINGRLISENTHVAAVVWRSL